ncbi:MAG: rhodanese-like domain-containing protein [Phycisphaerae bacterium]|nr:rhodanese-like domain-containing protein [Phycisphaerae bacterium]
MSDAARTLDDRGLPPGYPYRPEWEITPRELMALRAAGARPLVIDCRTEQERAICRIDNSTHVPLHELERKLDDLRDALEESDATTIVVHCHHGVRSLRATAVLRAAGFADVRSLAGGVDLWAVDIDPTIPKY